MGLTRIRAQQISDIDYKQAVRVISTDDVALVGGAPNQIDGVNLIAGDRILVIGQQSGSENGIYQVQTVGAGSNGTWIRTADSNKTGEIEAGLVIMVTEGETYKDTMWKLITNNPIVVGETALVFELNTPFGFGNIYANGTSVVAAVQSDVLTITAGDNISVVGNSETKTITFSAVSVSPGGNTTEIQYNSSGIFAGSNNFTFDGSNVSVTGNISANYFLGNGSQLTGLPVSYGNVQVAEYLPTYDGNLSPGNLTTTGIVTATGNVSGAYFLGNGSQLSGIITTVSNINNGTSNVSIDTANANIGMSVDGTANIVVVSSNLVEVTGGLTATGNIAGGNIISLGKITATGNIEGLYFIGNGSQLTGISAGGSGGISWTTASTAPSAPNPGDFWYDTDDDKTYQYVNDGVGNAWVDQSAPTSFGNLTVGNILNGGSNGEGNIGSSTTYFNTIFAKATSAQYADLAENYQADQVYEPGTVVVFGGAAEVTVSNVSHDTRVAGVVSTNPSYLMNSGLTGTTVAAVALTGRVPCLVQGPVTKGDRIVNVNSGIGGRMKSAEYEPGCIVGKSLEDITDSSIKLIEVVIGRF